MSMHNICVQPSFCVHTDLSSYNVCVCMWFESFTSRVHLSTLKVNGAYFERLAPSAVCKMKPSLPKPERLKAQMKFWQCGKFCVALLLQHVQCRAGIRNSGPWGQLSCWVYVQPWSNFLVSLKSLIFLYRCIRLALELNSSGNWTSRARVENSCCRESHFSFKVSETSSRVPLLWQLCTLYAHFFQTLNEVISASTQPSKQHYVMQAWTGRKTIQVKAVTHQTDMNVLWLVWCCGTQLKLR